MKNVALMGACSLALLITQSALALSGSIFYEANITNDRAEANATSPGFYSVVSTTDHVQSRMTGSGDFASVNQTQSEDQSQVIGKDIQGTAQLSVELKDERKNLVNVTEVDALSVPEKGVSVNLSYTAEGEIVSGSWADYQAGRDIRVKLTDAGNRATAAAISQSLADTLKVSLSNQLPVPPSDAKVNLSEPKNEGQCVLNKVKAICMQPNIHLQIQIDF